MGRSLLLTAVAFAAGLGLGYLLQPAPARDRAARSVPVEPSPVPLVAADPAARSPSPLPTPLPEIPRGDGSIHGRILDDTGLPIADVLVVAVPVEERRSAKSPKGLEAPLDRDLDEMSDDLVARERWRREARRTARTNADGLYEVTGLAPVKWSLQAYKKGYQLQPQGRGNAWAAECGSSVDFTGMPIVRADVDVRTADGSRPPSATIAVQIRRGNSTSGTSEAWLPSEPWIEVRPGTCEMTASTDTAKSATQTVTIDAESPAPLFFQLEERPGLRVRVIRPDDLPMIQPEVMALRFSGGKPPDPTRLRREGIRTTGPRHVDVTALQDLEPGTYLVGAAYSYDAPVAVTKVVEVAAGVTEHELRLPPPDTKDYLTVHVRDPDGGPPGPLQFTLACRAARRNTSNGANALFRADGAYLVRRLSPEGEEGGSTHSIIAEGALGQVEQVYDPSDAREILLQFQRPAFLDVAIEGYVGSPHAGWLQLGLVIRAERGRSYRLDRPPDAKGSCRLGPVQPGSYDLVLLTSPARFTTSTQPVELRSGDQAVTIGVPALHAVTVRWPGKGTRTFTLRRVDGAGGSLQRDVTEEGTTLERLPSGRYRVLVHSTSAQEPVEFDVPAQAAIEIK
jgi:hypothetical protein